MRVVILGAGQVGYNIARYLATEENDVTIVDQSPDLLRKISDNLDVQPIMGYASHPDVLKKAGLKDADLLIAVTASDEVNIVACHVGHALFNVQKKIARIRAQDYLHADYNHLFNNQNLFIDYIISPEVEVAHSISRSIRVMGAFNVISLAQDRLRVVGVHCLQSAPILNTPLRLLPSLFPKLDLAIACIERDGVRFMPTKDDQILLNDEVFFIAPSTQINAIMENFGFSSPAGRRVIILGGGSIGLTLACELEKAQHGTPHASCDIKIIEKNPQRAEFIARHLNHTEVLCGDVLDYQLLSEAHIHTTETVIAVTQDDKVNILSSLLAKRHGGGRALTLLNNMDYASLVMSLGVDAVICPHDITVSGILQYVRHGQIYAAHAIHDGAVEIIEAEPQENAHILGLTIEDIHITGQIHILALVRNQEIHISPSKTTIRWGDRLIFSVLKSAVHKIERLFSPRPHYL